MSYTIVDDDDVIQVRASINSRTQQDELKALIVALQKRQQEKKDDGQSA